MLIFLILKLNNCSYCGGDNFMGLSSFGVHINTVRSGLPKMFCFTTKNFVHLADFFLCDFFELFFLDFFDLFLASLSTLLVAIQRSFLFDSFYFLNRLLYYYINQLKPVSFFLSSFLSNSSTDSLFT